jgi:hypothetical protein
VKLRLILGGLAAATALTAWQGALANLKLNQETFETVVTSYLTQSGGLGEGEVRQPYVGRGVVQALLAMDNAGRSATVKELGQAAKALVMSPTFAKAYEDYLRQAHNAVNHGIVVKDAAAEMNAMANSGNLQALEAASNNMMRDMYRKTVSQRLPEVAKMNKEMIEIMAETDAGMMDMAEPETAADKARIAKAKAMVAEARKLSATDLEKARATYKSGLLLAAGLKDDSAAAANVDEMKKQEQQRNYNRLALKPVLKKKLQQFVTVAKTVDFNAALQPKGEKRVFSNPAYEKQSGLWKMLYRLGPGGTGAAVGVAQGWIAEL